MDLFIFVHKLSKVVPNFRILISQQPKVLERCSFLFEQSIDWKALCGRINYTGRRTGDRVQMQESPTLSTLGGKLDWPEVLY